MAVHLEDSVAYEEHVTAYKAHATAHGDAAIDKIEDVALLSTVGSDSNLRFG